MLFFGSITVHLYTQKHLNQLDTQSIAFNPHLFTLRTGPDAIGGWVCYFWLQVFKRVMHENWKPSLPLSWTWTSPLLKQFPSTPLSFPNPLPPGTTIACPRAIQCIVISLGHCRPQCRWCLLSRCQKVLCGTYSTLRISICEVKDWAARIGMHPRIVRIVSDVQSRCSVVVTTLESGFHKPSSNETISSFSAVKSRICKPLTFVLLCSSTDQYNIVA